MLFLRTVLHWCQCSLLTSLLSVQIFCVYIVALQLSPADFEQQVPSLLLALVPKVATDKDIQSNLNQLSTKAVDVSWSFRNTVLTEGGDLLRLKSKITKSLESGHCKISNLSCETNFSEVHTTLSRAMEKFSTVKDYLLALQTSVEGNIEPCHGKMNEYGRSAAEMAIKIDAMKSQLTDIDKQIGSAKEEAEASDRDAEWHQRMARELEKAAEEKKGKGLFGALVGFCLAPFTGGYSLYSVAAGALYAGAFLYDASEYSSRANEFRRAARGARFRAHDLRIEKNEAIKLKSTLEANIREKEIQKVQFEKASQSLQEVTQFLHGSTSVMDDLLRTLQNIDVTIQRVKLDSDAYEILQTALSNIPGSDITAVTANGYVTTLKQEWSDLEFLLNQLGARP